jgi:flagellar protein FlbD
MITLTKLNDRDIVVNCDQIETIETTPDTTITTSAGKKIIVLETPDEIVKRVVAYKRQIYIKDTE